MSADNKQSLPSSPGGPIPRAFWGWNMGGPGLICLLLALLTLAVYWPVARYGFVDYDDPEYVINNSHVQNGLTWETIVWAFKTGYAGNWHPLTWLSHALDGQLFGQHPGGSHLVNVGLHIGNALLLFLLLRQLTGAHWPSAVVAALFALHPLHVESVAWISERKDVLSTLFFMLTLLAYARYVASVECRVRRVESPKAEGRRAKEGRSSNAEAREAASAASSSTQEVGSSTLTVLPFEPSTLYYFAALVCFALGLMCKPALVTLPFVLLLLDYWPMGRVMSDAWRVAGNGNPKSKGGGSAAARDFSGPEPQRSVFSAARWLSRFQPSAFSLQPLLLEKLPFFLLAAASSVVTFLVQRHGGAVTANLPLGLRMANALVSYARYICKTFWPTRLSVLYPYPVHWPVWQVAASAVLLVVVCALLLWLARNRPALTVGWFWFLGTLVPMLGLVQVGLQSMADRYTYVPLIGLCILVVWGVSELVPLRPWRSKVLVLAAAYALAGCVFLTGLQVRYWRDSETLFVHATEVTERNYLAYYNLGFYLQNQGKTAEALDSYRKALAINPSYVDALSNLGQVLAGQGKYAEAIGYCESALRLQPQHLAAHNNLANALADLGRTQEAIEHYRFVLRQSPEQADAHNNLGVALAAQGKLDEAMSCFRDAIRLNPRNTSAYSNLGTALAAQHKWPEAVAQFKEVLRLNPNDAAARKQLDMLSAQPQ